MLPCCCFRQGESWLEVPLGERLSEECWRGFALEVGLDLWEGLLWSTMVSLSFLTFSREVICANSSSSSLSDVVEGCFFSFLFCAFSTLLDCSFQSFSNSSSLILLVVVPACGWFGVVMPVYKGLFGWLKKRGAISAQVLVP